MGWLDFLPFLDPFHALGAATVVDLGAVGVTPTDYFGFLRNDVLPVIPGGAAVRAVTLPNPVPGYDGYDLASLSAGDVTGYLSKKAADAAAEAAWAIVKPWLPYIAVGLGGYLLVTEA